MAKQGTRTGGSRPAANQNALKGKAAKGILSSPMVRGALVILILAAAVGIWRNRIDWKPRLIAQSIADGLVLSGSGGFPMESRGSENESIVSLQDGFIVVSDINLTVCSEKGKEADVRTHYMSSPAITSSGRYALLYDIGGKRLRVETAAKTLAAQTTEYTIAGGAISRTGRYALISHESIQLSMIDVFELDGEEVFKYHCEDHYITDVALSADGEYLAFSGVNASDGKLRSVLGIQHIPLKENGPRIEYSGDYIIAVEFLKSGYIAAVGNTSIMFVSPDFTKVNEIPYDGELQSFDLNYNSGVAVFTYQAKGAAAGTLTMYDIKGNKRFATQVTASSASLSLSDRGMAIYGQGKLNCFNLSGIPVGSCDISPTTQKVLMKGRRVYLLETSYLRLADY